jgi:hypothetical protein
LSFGIEHTTETQTIEMRIDEGGTREKCAIKSPYRTSRLVRQAIGKFGLNLDGLTILTEAASGNYIFTPIIAALSGARQVHAITKDSRYAPAEQIMKNTLSLAEAMGTRKKIKIYTSLKPDVIGDADIITNLGFVRPIDRNFISHLKTTAVIPLMYETWEYRKEDLDLAECQRKGIAVLGTNERVDKLQTFAYIGNLAMKLAFELDVEVFKSNVIVVGGEHFGKSTVNAFTNASANVVNFRIAEGDSLASKRFKDELTRCDLLIFVEHQSKELLLGDGGQLSVKELLKLNPGISIVHIAGGVEEEAIRKAQIPYRPQNLSPVGYMSVTTAYLGPKPVIDLHTAGLKVGELLARGRLRGLSREEAEKEALMNPLCQSFVEESRLGELNAQKRSEVKPDYR